MHRYLRLFALTAMGLGAAASNAQTPPPAIDGPVYVATYVEVLPNAVKDATALLKQYRDATRKDAGNQRAEVVHEANRPTRFVVLTIWATRKPSMRMARQHIPASSATSSRPSTPRRTTSVWVTAWRWPQRIP